MLGPFDGNSRSAVMVSAFKNRRPWAAAVLTFLFSPVLGMCYLGKGRWALIYLLLMVLAFCLLPVAAHLGELPIGVEPANNYAIILFNIVGAIHGYRVGARAGAFVPQAWFARWYSLVLFWFFPVVLALVIRNLLWEPFYAPAGSMEPSLRVGDHFFVSRYAYRVGEPQRGDIVAFFVPNEGATAYVKRLIGLPGDRIQMKGGLVHINGERLPQAEVEQRAGEHGELYRETLPKGRSYLIRDMAEHMPLDDTEVFEVPPDHFFFLGDNRDNSIDSRILDHIGFVPRENLIGPVTLIYWNSEAQRFHFINAD